MGCLNSGQGFEHWFGNIHLSGPCNRSCYFCIGQHMMALDPLNNLNEWPIKNVDEFIEKCKEHGVTEINLTGSNTDPLLYKHLTKLTDFLRREIPTVRLGIRTNGVLALKNYVDFNLFDKASISITSLDPELYRKTMGAGGPPNIAEIARIFGPEHLKVNLVLCPETIQKDLYITIAKLSNAGIQMINLREPYGQPRIGDPLSEKNNQTGEIFGMMKYEIMGTTIVYWDVHYVEVESVNLYANGKVSLTYPITKGHCDETGEVKDQIYFTGGRQREQWIASQ